MNNTYPAPAVTPAEREAARLQLLAKEKDLTRARDALAADRRRMPWLTADQVAHLAHLNARDTTLAFASRAPDRAMQPPRHRRPEPRPITTDAPKASIIGSYDGRNTTPTTGPSDHAHYD